MEEEIFDLETEYSESMEIEGLEVSVVIILLIVDLRIFPVTGLIVISYDDYLGGIFLMILVLGLSKKE
jgi:hypothetical protein